MNRTRATLTALAASALALLTVPAAWWYPDSLVCSAFPVFCN